MEPNRNNENDEETIQTIRSQRKPHNRDKITDARSESRKEFMKITTKDPKTKLQELPLKQAKERRQNTIKEKRIMNQEEDKMSDPKQLVKLIKELRGILESYMNTTNQEIENIKKIIELSYIDNQQNRKKLETIESVTKERIQNIIDRVKEIDSQKNTESKYQKFKAGIKSMTAKDSQAQYTSPYTLQREISKAILMDKYIQNKACVVVRNENGIFKYQVYTSYTYNVKRNYIRYKGKWSQIKFIFNELKNRGLVFGKRISLIH